MAFLVPFSANALSTSIEVVAEIFMFFVKFLMRKNAAEERRRALFRNGQVDDTMRHNPGSIFEQLSIIRGKQWTLFGRVLGIVTVILFASGLTTGPLLQTQVDRRPILNEKRVGLRTIQASDTFCRDGNYESMKLSVVSLHATSTSYDYVQDHGIQNDKFRDKVSVPRVVDMSKSESIYPSEDNPKANDTIGFTVGDFVNMRVKIKDTRVSEIWKGTESTNFIRKLKEDNYQRDGRWFQNVNSTLFFDKIRQKWEPQGSEGMILVMHKNNFFEYKIILIDVLEYRFKERENKTYTLPVRTVDVKFSQPTAWPDSFQELCLHHLGFTKIRDDNVVKVCAFVLAIHWASVTATNKKCSRKMTVLRTRSTISSWAFYLAVGVLGLSATTFLIVLIRIILSRNMPNILDDCYKALVSCFRGLNGVPVTNETSRLSVQTVQTGVEQFEISWKIDNTSPKVSRVTRRKLERGE